MRHCYILCGVPGSGKSTWAQEQGFHEGIIYSADSYFMKDGKYQFDPSQLGEAHSNCLRRFIAHGCQFQVAEGLTSSLVVDNTNTTSEEIATYYTIAKAYGYAVHLRTFVVDAEVAFNRNQHGVSLATIMAMNVRLLSRRLPAFWKFESQEVLVSQ